MNVSKPLTVFYVVAALLLAIPGAWLLFAPEMALVTLHENLAVVKISNIHSQQTGLGLLLAGVAGNLTDRVLREPGPMRGHVIAFLMLPNWPVFNIADVCINVAAGIILVQAFRGVRLDGTRVPEEDDA